MRCLYFPRLFAKCFTKTANWRDSEVAHCNWSLRSPISLPHAMNPIYNRLSVWGPGGRQPTSIEVTIQPFIMVIGTQETC